MPDIHDEQKKSAEQKTQKQKNVSFADPIVTAVNATHEKHKEADPEEQFRLDPELLKVFGANRQQSAVARQKNARGIPLSTEEKDFVPGDIGANAQPNDYKSGSRAIEALQANVNYQIPQEEQNAAKAHAKAAKAAKGQTRS